MSSGDGYQVRLSSFEGPLDLLLFLIRRAEVDIHDIPIAQITQQYLDTVAGARDLDVEQAGEFLVMAATLVEIKSRMLAPPSEGDAAEDPLAPSEAGEDPRRDLVRQLLAYQRFRTAADGLDRLRREYEQRWPASGAATVRRGEARAGARPTSIWATCTCSTCSRPSNASAARSTSAASASTTWCGTTPPSGCIRTTWSTGCSAAEAGA